MSEKEKTTPEETPAAETAPQDKNAAEPSPREVDMPDVSFSTFVLSLASSALMCLGEVPDPETGQTTENLPLARHTIDVLCMLEDKIKNGLDADESRLLEGLLYEVRMKYVMKKQ